MTPAELIKAREELGATQQVMADVLGMHIRTYQRFELGENLKISIPMAYMISDMVATKRKRQGRRGWRKRVAGK